MTITRMQEPRQLYGLGSLVKKITKPIKKIIKSPIGKAALLVGGAGLAGFGPAAGLRGSTLGQALFGGATKMLPANIIKGAAVTTPGIFGKAASMFGNLSTGTKLGLGGAFASYLMSTGASEDEVEEIKRDKGKLSIYLKDYFTKLNPNASDQEVEEFVTTNTSEYAIGGRVGLRIGSGEGKDVSGREYSAPSAAAASVASSPSRNTGGGDSGSPTISPVVKNAINLGGDISYLKNLIEMNPLGIMKNVGGKFLFDKIIGDQTSLNTEEDDESNMLFADALTTPSADTMGLNLMDRKTLQDAGYNNIQIQELQNNPNINTQDVIRDIRGPIFAAAYGGMPTGIMRTNQAGTMERDYRETGGFVPVGIKEKADDVPAMLSKNEFVMTADAVRGIGDGNIEKGAQRLYDQMKTAEKRVV